jgi:hypothetical protein
MACLSALNFGRAAILVLAATTGMTVGVPVSAQTPRATSENSQRVVGTVTNNLGTGALFGGSAATQFNSSRHVVVEVLCLDPSTEAVQPLFIGTDLVCAPH